MNEFGNKDHKIYQGDTIEVLQNKIEDDSIDLIFVDPPYNIGKDFNGLKDKWQNDSLISSTPTNKLWTTYPTIYH